MKSASHFALALAIAAAPLAVAAQNDFPSKPIEVVNNSSYSGGTDTTARMTMIRSRRNLETDMYDVSMRVGADANA